ncbi:hypothetical protein ASPACDRAFT_64710 [Aspergillus aculeatus ATCC 16872]|uniref:2EXR domain-containing protein n=1 Tax=Aspergillus aculeatus (strain ATCC 16872 / CBS 172.66 / WB 5094) TaxID=690307 RepID=A0A1L9WG01_ASPA1|nr:uncharacterized protein ASPACDRAFT_64710 [Aspergillus aculeatus ATCC 16872]OJJ95108.1 hypothetical protein ASPACDRAFT_64710 [Aspergillus aculeatus ATCC 16872]
MATSEFPSFSRLPAEIRLMIWNAALPGPINNPLFFWRTVKLQIHRLDDKYDYYDDWVPDLIRPIEMGFFSVKIPLLKVNKEAHKDFLSEVWNMFYVLSLDGPGRFPNHENAIRRVALPQQMLMDSRLAPLPRLFNGGVQLWCRNLYVVVDAPAALRGVVTNGSKRVTDSPNWGLEVLDDFPRASCTRPGG